MFCRVSYHGYIAATPEPWRPSFQVPALPKYMLRSHIVYTILLTDFNLFCPAIHIHVSQCVCFVQSMLIRHTQRIPTRTQHRFLLTQKDFGSPVWIACTRSALGKWSLSSHGTQKNDNPISQVSVSGKICWMQVPRL